MDKQTNKNEPYKRNIDTPATGENENDKSAKPGEDKKGKKRVTAAELDAIISSPTANVRARHETETWANTGTNISYEGQTAPGGMGSVGTGQASGQDATGASINVPDADNVRPKKEDDSRDTEREEEDGADETKDII